MISKQNIMIIVLQIIIVFLFHVTIAQEQLDFQAYRCQFSDNITTPLYQDNMISVLAALTNQSSELKFFETSVGTGNDLVNGLYVCRPDLSLDTCNSCLKKSVIHLITYCSTQKEAIEWYEECIVHYSNNTISATLQTFPWWWSYSIFNVSQPDTFPKILNNTLNEIITKASVATNKDYFAYNSTDYTAFEGFYGMAWCTPDIKPAECKSCLTSAFDRLPGDRLGEWAYVLLPSCVLRYDTAPFIFPASPPAP